MLSKQLTNFHHRKNIALVGCGAWGKNLIRCFNKLGVLKGIYDVDRSKMEQYADPDLVLYSSYQDVLGDSEIDGVVIAVPVEDHYSVALQAIHNGKDVFVEKPIASSKEESLNLVKAAEENDRVLLVGHILEYHPALQKLRSTIDEGAIGEVREIYSHRLNTGKMRKFENVWWSFAPHDVLLILNTLNQPITSLQCVMSDYLERGVADTTITTFKFEKGCFAHIYVSWTHPFKVHSFVVIGTEGAIEFTDSRAENKLLLYTHQLDKESESITKGSTEVIEFSSAEPLMEECKDFVNCIHTRSTPLSSGRDGLRVVEVLTDAMESAV